MVLRDRAPRAALISSLTRGRVMRYAIPEHLHDEHGVTSIRHRTDPWDPTLGTPSNSLAEGVSAISGTSPVVIER
ncbi:hypothetical protein CP971_29000 [Streptomyces viridifaciens]|nr:hypothetical protein CP971_29000 [Streptomyces viridifaciens]